MVYEIPKFSAFTLASNLLFIESAFLPNVFSLVRQMVLSHSNQVIRFIAVLGLDQEVLQTIKTMEKTDPARNPEDT